MRDALRALWRGWQIVGKKIAYVQSMIIMTIAYWIVLAPFALAVRIWSDPLRLRLTAGTWEHLAPARDDEDALAAARQQG